MVTQGFGDDDFYYRFAVNFLYRYDAALSR